MNAEVGRERFRRSPPASQPKNVKKNMVLQPVIAGFGLHEAPHMGGLGDNDPMGESLLLLILTLRLGYSERKKRTLLRR